MTHTVKNVSEDDDRRSAPLLIRSNHPDAFRSGQWAKIVDTVHYVPIGHDVAHPMFVVEWVDGKQDQWPIGDLSARYEFDRDVTS